MFFFLRLRTVYFWRETAQYIINERMFYAKRVKYMKNISL